MGYATLTGVTNRLSFLPGVACFHIDLLSLNMTVARMGGYHD